LPGVADSPVAETTPETPASGAGTEEEVHLHYATPALATPAPTVLHSGMTVAQYYAMHAMGAIFPATAAIIVFGWRALGVLALTLASAVAGLALWRNIGRRGSQLRFSHVLWMATLLALMLPPHLFAPRLWPMIVGAGVTLVIFTWLLGGIGGCRVHPVLLTFLLLVILFPDSLISHGVLQPHRLFVGDVAKVRFSGPSSLFAPREAWVQTAPGGPDVLWREPASQTLLRFTAGVDKPERASLSLEDMIRDQLPPLEDLIIAGQPGPLGQASAIAVIIGGLFLLYQGLIDFRVPLFILLASFASLLIFPIPTLITETARHSHWLALRQPGVGWAVAITFANYEMLAGPMVLVAFFFATSPAIRPMFRRGRVIYAVAIGIMAAGLQLYLNVGAGAILALLVGSMLTPFLDRIFSPRTLV